MYDKKNILGLFFIFCTIVIQAQDNKIFIPPDMTQEIHSFELPALLVDSIFIENLHTVLFDKSCDYLNSIVSNPRAKSWHHFFIRFEKKDCLNYCIEVSLWDIPVRKSAGFFEYNGFLYWFGYDVPPNIILGTKSKKRFSYKEPIPAPYDPPFWYLAYNVQTGCIEVKSKNFTDN